jgi:hypothetical protein
VARMAASAASKPIPLLVPVISTDAILIFCAVLGRPILSRPLGPDWDYSELTRGESSSIPRGFHRRPLFP